jgi:oligopeptide/dipeptide ABC transporter ATP-binding protein
MSAASPPAPEPILRVRDLVKTYPARGFRRRAAGVRAVAGVSFDVHAGETLSLVGESGCGKSTTARCVLRIIEPTAGSVRLGGRELIGLGPRELRRARREIQMVFQDPRASLNPRQTVREIVAEPLVVQGTASAEVAARVEELMDLVALRADTLDRYPHQFSGGQRQRVGIARALALAPSVVVLDEPVSALDVSIQAEIIGLLERLGKQLGLAFLFIAHDLSVVRHVTDRVAVMYLGRIAEIGPAESVYSAPAHPYTQALLSAAPIPDPLVERAREHIVLRGDVADPAAPPSGCRFRTRCPKAREVCAVVEPELLDPGVGHRVACHFPEPVDIISRLARVR